MKKNTLLLIFLFLLTLNWQINAQLTEDFETTPLTGWTHLQSEDDDPGFVQNTSKFHNGSASFYHNDDNVSVESTSWMISPMHTVNTGELLEFWYQNNHSATYYVESGVWISTNSNDPFTNPNDFTELLEFGDALSEDTWTKFSQDLTAYDGQSVYIAFKYRGDWKDEIYIDDFSIQQAPACPDVTNLTATNFTSPGNADLSWDLTTNATGYNWEIQPQDVAQGNNNPIASGSEVTNSVSISNLVNGTDYTLYVQSICGTNGPGNYTSLNFSFNLPPANDECINAITLTVNTDENCTNITSGTTSFATASMEDSTICTGTENDDVWYSFVAIDTKHEIKLLNTSAVTGFDRNLFHSLWEGSCGSLTQVGVCSNPDSSIQDNLIIGNTYYLRINSYATSPKRINFDVCIGIPPTPPANNECSNATILSCDDNLTGETTVSATDNGDATGCESGKGVWYKFIGNDNYVTVTATPNSGFDIRLNISSSNDCTNFTNITCQDGSLNAETTTFNADLGTEYYIYIADYSNTSSRIGDFDIAISCVPYPPCPDIENLEINNLSAPNTANFTWNDSQGATGYNWEIQLQGIAQGNPNPIDNGTSTTNMTDVSNLIEGTDYTLYVQSDCGNNEIGNYTSLNFTFILPPANDLMENAIPITPLATGTGCSTYNFTAHIANDGTTDSGLDGSCNLTYTGLDVFYSWTATTDALLWNKGDGNPGIVIRDTAGTEIICASTGASADYELSGWQIGDELIMQIYDWGTSDVNVTFCLEELMLPTCLSPTSLTSENITLTGANLGWTENNDPNVSNWDIYIVTGGETAPVISTIPTLDNQTTNPISWSNGISSTTYDYYVRTDCDADNIGVSEWSGPFTFTTLCEANETYPWVENFESIIVGQPGCWNIDGTTTNNSYHWSSDSMGETGRGIRFNSWLNSVGNTSELTTMILNLTSLTNPQLKLDFKNPTGGNFEVLISSNGGTTYTSLETGLTDQTDWLEKTYDLSSYSSETVIIKFLGTSNYGSGDAYIYLDNVTVESNESASVNELEAIGFTYYPNPVNDELTLSAKENINSITIFNTLGQEVLHVEPSNMETKVNVAKLANGTYFVKAKVGDTIGTFKVIKN